MPELHLDIHFQKPDEVSVVLGPTGDGAAFAESELLLFCLYATRQVLTLGAAHGFGLTLAALLLHAGESPRSLLADGPLGARVVPHPGTAGPRRFRARLEYTTSDDPAGIRFGSSHVGFGVLGRGLSHYAPVSVLALLTHLLARRDADARYLDGLAAATRHLGATLPHAESANQVGVALNAAAVGRGEFFRGAEDDRAVDQELAAAGERFLSLWRAGEAPADVREALGIAARALVEPDRPEAGGDGPQTRLFARTALGGYLWREAEAGETARLDRALAKAALAAAAPGAEAPFNLFAAARRCVIDGIPLSHGSPGGLAAFLEAGYRTVLGDVLAAEERGLVDPRLLRVAFRCGTAVHDLTALFEREPALVEALRTKPRHRSFRLTREPEAITLAPGGTEPEHRSFRLSRRE